MLPCNTTLYCHSAQRCSRPGHAVFPGTPGGLYKAAAIFSPVVESEAVVAQRWSSTTRGVVLYPGPCVGVRCGVGAAVCSAVCNVCMVCGVLCAGCDVRLGGVQSGWCYACPVHRECVLCVYTDCIAVCMKVWCTCTYKRLGIYCIHDACSVGWRRWDLSLFDYIYVFSNAYCMYFSSLRGWLLLSPVLCLSHRSVVRFCFERVWQGGCM